MTTTQQQQQGLEITRSLSPTSISHSKIDLSLSSSECHGFWRDAALAVPAALFVLYLAFHAKKNLRKLSNGRNYVTIAYYALLWLAALLNLAWCSLQAWQCSSGKEVAWNLLSLFTTAGILCLEISLMAFLIQENHSTGFETLARAFTLSGFIVGVDILLKAIFVFGFRVPLFVDSEETTHRMKWGLWTVSKILLAAVYGFILFVHSSKWQDKLPSRPMFYNYVVTMFLTNAVALFACALAGIGLTFGLWLYNLMLFCYHCLYLPFLYITFSADIFQEEDLRLDNAYYSEMKDAGFFDVDWD
ncbi:protein CANDIDATE G-PROTEIN COUPLED RECEPTOR 2-like isoform X1 [Rhododendron vialii]|uniref:protein CANDIDATE G-PROTEIN COUPLED RECEPTOR 2-like isoform X1 n=1 Tax=Rhododendron vialii TaxID=182163 RepID=UPI00265E5633|nr:protein CANDIDATE G-PROTEIN COUPLED RECEPTOR 2-like isoform X1 [Rhododendron vialii]